jgi:hypothetical protein
MTRCRIDLEDTGALFVVVAKYIHDLVGILCDKADGYPASALPALAERQRGDAAFCAPGKHAGLQSDIRTYGP